MKMIKGRFTNIVHMGSIDIVVSKIAPIFLACEEGLIQFQSEAGVEIVADYNLRISRNAQSCLCLVLVC